MISAGTTAAAARPGPVRTPARISIPAVPRPNGRVSGSTRNGASSTAPPTSSSTIIASVLASLVADGNSAATATSVAIPATRQPRPPKSRAGAMRDGSTAASRSASVGRIRPARRAATSTDTTATATPARNAMTRAGTEPAVSCTLNQAGDRPRPAIQRASSGAQITPSRQPRAEPATPTRAASARTIRATCRRRRADGAEQGQVTAALGDGKRRTRRRSR